MSQTDLITAFQEDVARTFFDLPESEGFLLAGGAALIALGAVERATDDLDSSLHVETETSLPRKPHSSRDVAIVVGRR